MLLERLIAKVMQKVMDVTKKVIGNIVSGVKELEKSIHAENTPAVQSERKKIPFPVRPHRESDMQGNTEHQAIAPTEKEIIIRQIKAAQKPVFIETEQTAERPPYPKPSVLTAKYPRLKKIDNRLKEQNKAIFEREKKRLSSIVKEYKFDSVQAFYKEFNAAKREKLDYETACTDWEKTYGDKAANSMSIRDKLRQKEQIVKERETGRMHQAKQKDNGAR